MFKPSNLIKTTFALTTCLTLALTACMGTSDSIATSDNSDSANASTTNTTQTNTQEVETLEVISVYGESDGDSVELISLDGTMKYRTIMSIPNLGDNYIPLEQGDRVKIAGSYAESYPVQIYYITAIAKVANPDKQQCEAKGNIWRPEGKAQIPTCVEQYSDGGKTCTSSSECEGDCMVTDENQPAQCASDNSHFGCGSSIEDFKTHGGILCVD